MKTIILSLILVSVAFLEACSQSQDSTIVRIRRSYFLDGKRISGVQLEYIYRTCPQAQEIYYRAKSNRGTGRFLGFGGLVYAGASFVVLTFKGLDDANKGNMDYDLDRRVLIHAGVGFGFSLIGLSCVLAAPKMYQQAVDSFNGRHKNTGSNPVTYSLITGPDGLGIRLTF